MDKRVAVISEDLVAPWDEGIKKFAYSIGTSLRADHDVRILNIDRENAGESNGVIRMRGTRTFMSPALRSALREFNPDAILYVPSPSSTLASFVRTFALRRHAPKARIAMVALIPRRHSSRMRPFLDAACPDIIFVPSYSSLLHLNDLQLPGALAPVGVDLSVFRPPVPGEREALREKYSVPQGSFVYLHVGHLSAKRNVRQFEKLAGIPGVEAIVIGSTSTEEDRSVRAALEQSGVRVIREYVAVEEFYRLADCYVFPVVDHEGCVEIPLSVIESLASGLRVVSRAFGGLRDFLKPGPDLVYCDRFDDLTTAALAARDQPVVEVRSMDEFDWDNIARRLMSELEGASS